MYQPRTIQQQQNWLDETGIKIYTISYNGSEVDHQLYREALKKLKSKIDINWHETPSFAIFHQGELYPYLILCYWYNGNELFTKVFVHISKQWILDPEQFSFCLYDMEIMWAERNIFIDTIDNGDPSLVTYQKTRLPL